MSWVDAELQDLVLLQRGFDITKAQQRPGDIPVISSSGPQSFHNECKVKGPGVIVGRKGSVGTVYYSETDFWPHDTTLWSKDLKGNIPKFVYYFLRTLQLRRFDTGNSNPTLNRNHIHKLPIKKPDLGEQARIVSVLSAYDDLIENNRRRIALLEEVARLLYREWFVHFCFPGHEHVKIVDALPEGWDEALLGELVAIIKGRNITKNTVEPGEVPVVAGGLNPAYYHSKANTKAPVVTISASGANAGYVNLYHIDVWASDCSYIDARATEHPFFFYLTLKEKQAQITAMQIGAAQPHVYPKDLMRLKIVKPKETVLNAFSDIVAPIFRQVQALGKMSLELEKARYFLLPRLMDGRLEV